MGFNINKCTHNNPFTCESLHTEPTLPHLYCPKKLTMAFILLLHDLGHLSTSKTSLRCEVFPYKVITSLFHNQCGITYLNNLSLTHRALGRSKNNPLLGILSTHFFYIFLMLDSTLNTYKYTHNRPIIFRNHHELIMFSEPIGRHYLRLTVGNDFKWCNFFC